MITSNKENEALISQEYLKSILEYSPETGDFVRLVETINRKGHIGDVAGYLDHGYVRIKINTISYGAHRLAWLYMTGNWPNDQIDHKNHIRNDNRWENLRDVIHKHNSYNRGENVNNTTGYKGVYEDKRSGLYTARITVNGIGIYLGTFITPKEASIVYEASKIIYHKID
jgi:hypothetical protein